MEWTAERKGRAAACATAEELHALAAAAGVPMKEEEARTWFVRPHPPLGEISDDEMENVSGGGCGGGGETSVPRTRKVTGLRTWNKCPQCGYDCWYDAGTIGSRRMNCAVCSTRSAAGVISERVPQICISPAEMTEPVTITIEL